MRGPSQSSKSQSGSGWLFLLGAPSMGSRAAFCSCQHNGFEARQKDESGDAPVIERDGKWYLYAPLHGRGIGVLVADNSLGPHIDRLKKPLIGGSPTLACTA